MMCPVREPAAFRSAVSIPAAPVSIGDMYAGAETAHRVPQGDIDLSVRESCGLVHNITIDPTLVVYDRQYENSQMFSPTFRRFAEHLAADPVSRYGLTGKQVGFLT